MSEVVNNPYRALRAYAASPPAPYQTFDSATQTGLNLFALREDFDFDTLCEILDKIIAVLPALKRIFSEPIIRLRDSNEILPVEAVRIVNNKTLSHISVHSELWSNIQDGRLLPRKLMTIRYEDDYAIYENIIFARTVDIILNFTAKNLSVLRNMLYANHELRFNLLERENHPLYFLALGKLHTGYLRDYDKYLLPIEKCFERLNTIEHTLIPRLSMAVYKKCRKKTTKLALKKTNIFRSHKDYRKLYSLAKFFSDSGLDSLAYDIEDPLFDRDYLTYCSMLCVFAAGHFNFTFDSNQTINFTSINTNAGFGDWHLNIREEAGIIALTVSKDSKYRILLCPPNCEATADADEIIHVSPDGNNGIRLSIYDIESFRRIQQILLRGIINTDKTHEICPFCGKTLKVADDGSFECGACRTVIKENSCPETNKYYFTTQIKYFRNPKKTKKYSCSDGTMFFRNITPINENCEFLCPHCGKVH